MVKSDIVVSKAVKNVTDGFDARKNAYALVNDVLEYTITVENVKLGSAWYDAKVYDALPVGVQYIPGSTVIKNNAFGTTVAPSAEQDDALYGGDASTARVLGFALGDVHGGTTAVVTFRALVTPDAVLDGTPVPDNVASATGTKPSDTIVYPEGVDPDGFDPSGDTPIEVVEPTDEPNPFNPEDEAPGEEVVIPEGPGSEPGSAKPDGTSHTDPDHAKFTTTKTAEIVASADEGEDLEEREEGKLYVGDTVSYRIEFANADEPYTAWYDVTVYDRLPKGMVPVPGTFRLTAPGQTEPEALDDSVYDAAEGDVAVWVGRVLGGERATLTFDCVVTEEALDSDVGNVATVAGTDPSATDPDVLDGDPSKVPGLGKRTPKPQQGWDAFFEERGAEPTAPAYPGSDGPVTVERAPGSNGGDANGDGTNGGDDANGNGTNGNDPNGGVDGPNGIGGSGGDDSGLAKGGADGQAGGLSKTGDAAPLAALALASAIALAALALLRRRGRDRG